jgi:hypothetical protein
VTWSNTLQTLAAGAVLAHARPVAALRRAPAAGPAAGRVEEEAVALGAAAEPVGRAAQERREGARELPLRVVAHWPHVERVPPLASVDEAHRHGSPPDERVQLVELGRVEHPAGGDCVREPAQQVGPVTLAVEVLDQGGVLVADTVV